MNNSQINYQQSYEKRIFSYKLLHNLALNELSIT